MISKRATVAALTMGLAIGATGGFGAGPAVAAGKGYGCFLVTTDEVNIRERPYANAKVIGTAVKGDILIKRKMLCTLRGYWCAIRAGSVDGYVDKAFMQKITCP